MTRRTLTDSLFRASIISCVIALASLGVSSPAFGASLDDIQTTIEHADWSDKRPLGAPDPVKDADTTCKYSVRLKETITILGDQTWYDWFSKNGNKGGKFKSALQVVEKWKANAAGTSLFSKVEALANHLKGNALTFPELVLQIHLGVANSDITGSVKNLVDAGFLFPLLNPSPKLPPLSDRLDHLNILVRDFDGEKVGGLGNLTFKELFYTPAHPDHYSDSMLQMIVNAQYAGLIPLPEMDCEATPFIDPALYSAEKYEPSEIIRLMVANEKCCCRTARTCSGQLPPANCNTCSTYCCLAGVTWCPSVICP